MNKKGFVISTTLYGIFGIMLITIATILFVMASNRTTVDAMSQKVKMCIEECNTPEDICGEIDNPTPINKIVADNVLQYKKVDTTKYAVSEEYYNSASDKTYLTKDENGLFVEIGGEGTTYFFRGAVNNNYFSFAGKTWRILRINSDGTLRLILNDVMDDMSTSSIKLNSGDRLVNNNARMNYTYINPIFDYSDKSNGNYYIQYENGKRITYQSVVSSTDTYKSIYNFDIYSNILSRWYSKNISNNTSYSNKVVKGNFCIPSYYYHSDNSDTRYFYYDSTFDCKPDIVEELADAEYYGESISKNIGLINFSELKMAGYAGRFQKFNVYDKGKDFLIMNLASPSVGFEDGDNFLNIQKEFLLVSPFQYYSSNYDWKGILVNGMKTEEVLIRDNKFTKIDNVGGFDLMDKNLTTNVTFDIYSNSSSSARVTFDALYIRNLRPVINLKADILLTGKGTIDNPYKIAS